MRRTLDSLVAQTIPPALLVVVDDGSTDDTPKILAEYAAKHEWIRVVKRPDRGTRSVGPGVIEAFYAGFDTVNLDGFDYVCKLDLDLVLPPGYFEGLMKRMEAEPRIGTCSGKAYYPGPANSAKDFAGELISEGIGDEVSVGASKFFRVSCFQQIGGFVRQVMWDGIDCHHCRMRGWIACSWDDPELRFMHLRPMGTSHQGIWTGRKRHGYGQYFMGTSLAYMSASAIYRLARPPLIVGGLAIWWGYVASMVARKPRYDDPPFRRFLRRYQWASLLRGKAAAVRALNERQASVWSPGAAHPVPPPRQATEIASSTPAAAR
ncbi:MAG: glycosyltransferase family 2 protein [Phycisphaerales bacterium]|nr:glycosyltransferase family 2 protein [Phycisphaerales bacterium]